MNWYYVSGGQQMGPIDDAECRQLFESGTLSSDTLVWREGMADWQPWSKASEDVSAAAVPEPATTPVSTRDVTCAHCGQQFPLEQVVRLAGNTVCAACKPLAMQKMAEGVHSTTNAEEIRRTHLSHEASIRSVGFLYFMGAAFLVLVGVVSLSDGRSGAALLGLFFVLLGAGQFWVGAGLRKLKPWSRTPAGILSGIGLLGFPIGTLINGYILYLLLSRKGSTIFSPEYQSVIAQTPHLKYRTSIIVWILLGLLVGLIGLALVAALLASASR